MRPRHVVIALLVVAALAAGVVIVLPYVWGRGTSTEVSLDDVVRRYQASTTVAPPSTTAPTSAGPTSTGPSGDTLPPPPPTVRPGVYVYTTTGRDEVDALNGDHHDYPDSTTITVIDLGDGCRRHRWDVLVERWQEWQRCARDDGTVAVVGLVNFDSFFNRSQTDTYECSGDGRPLDAPAGTTWSFRCVQGDTDLDVYTGVVVGHEQVQVGTDRLDALHVRVSIDNGVAGDVQVTDSWYLLGTDLLLAEVAANDTTNPSPIGDVHYRERYDIRLAALEPIT